MSTKNNNQPPLSRQQRTGAFILAFLLLCSIIIWRLLPVMQANRPLEEQRALQLAWQKFEATHLDTLPSKRGYTAYDQRASAPGFASVDVPIKRTAFDPNTASEQQLLALGLPLRTVRTLIKYRNKGGRFYKPQDLSKLYNLSKEDYEKILPYAHIAMAKAEDRKDHTYTADSSFTKQEYQQALIDLNQADASALIALRGIGPGYAKRILAFREGCGGFLEVSQLREVYGFPDSTYQQLKDRFTVNAADVKKINVNQATEEELARHPYIGKRLAASIIKLRADFKTFTGIEQLRQTPLINEEKYRKIAPYLSL